MPNKGDCPECGQSFDIKRHVGVRTPDSPIERSQRIYARTRTIVMATLGCLFLAVACYAQFILKFSLAMYTVGVAGVLFLLFAAISYVSESDD